MGSATRVWWIAVIVLATACGALGLGSRAAAAALLVVGLILAATGGRMLFRQNRRR
jgi:hypothetical protein